MIPPQAITLGLSTLGKLLGESSSSVVRGKMISLGNNYLGNYDLNALGSLAAFGSSSDPRKQGLANYTTIGLSPALPFAGNITQAEAQKVLNILKNVGAIDGFNRPIEAGVIANARALGIEVPGGLNSVGAIGTMAKTNVTGNFQGSTSTNLIPATSQRAGIGPLILLIPVALFFAHRAKVI